MVFRPLLWFALRRFGIGAAPGGLCPGVVRLRIFTAAGGRCVRRAAWRRPLVVTDLGAFGPKVLLLPSSAQNTPPGCICGELDYKALASYFLFLSQKESKQSLSALRAAYGGCAPRRACGRRNAPSGKMRKVFRPLRRATRAPPWTCRPLKRAALNFTPFVTQMLSWVLPGVLTAFCPKRKIAPTQPGKG